MTFGLVSIPVQLTTAARRKSIDLDLLHKKDHSRVRQVLYCRAENKPLERSDIVKGFEYQKGHYVEIDPKELEKVKPESAKTMEILEFVGASEVDPIYLDTSYYLLPDEGGEKPYTLLYIAMHKTNFYALAKVTMRQREYTVLIRCGPRGLMLHTMFYADELRQEQAFRAEPRLVSDRELELAKNLIENLSAPFEPNKYKDTYRERMEEFIQARIKGKKIAIPPAAKAAPVIDIMEALKKSLAAKKRPQLVATVPKKPVARKVVAKKRKAS